jgi:SAM-dependent methyltransferase
MPRRSRIATRLKLSGERQYGVTLSDIRADHRARYEWAAAHLAASVYADRWAVLDAACGCGYGTATLAHALPNCFVNGVDIDAGAVLWGANYWKRPNNAFSKMDLANFGLFVPAPGKTPTNEDNFDAIVSFETLEHVQADSAVLANFARALRPGGVLLISVPNQSTTPFSKRKYPFHVRHYTPMELDAVLTLAGFRVTEWYTQLAGCNDVVAGAHGKTVIAVAVKP